jgi:hypothetical protein
VPTFAQGLECRVNTPITEHRPITEHPYSAGVGLCWIKKNLMGVVTLAYRQTIGDGHWCLVFFTILTGHKFDGLVIGLQLHIYT